MKINLRSMLAAPAVVLATTLTMPISAFANNAFNLVGYGVEALSMGGADSAIANSPSL